MPDISTDIVTTAAGSAVDGRRFVPPTTRIWPVHWRVPTAADLQALAAGYRRGLVPAHAPLLHDRMPPLAVGSPEAEAVAQRLYEAARREIESGNRRMVGLAAPQVGIRARAFLFDTRSNPAVDSPSVRALRCLINPVVEPVGPDLVREVEGCLSIPPIKGWVTRAARVRLRGRTPAGEPVDEQHTGLSARVLQHELDHLDGVLFPQRIGEDCDLLWASVEQLERFNEYARAHRRGEKPPWNIRTPRDQWHAIPGGLAVFGALAAPAEDEQDRVSGGQGPVGVRAESSSPAAAAHPAAQRQPKRADG